jgi:hypothetical protein
MSLLIVPLNVPKFCRGADTFCTKSSGEATAPRGEAKQVSAPETYALKVLLWVHGLELDKII